MDYNLAIEQAQNEMLLLNILRSSRKRPLYLTSVTTVTGSNSAEVALGLSLPGDDTAGGTFSVNPTFDVPVLDSKEFMSGFLTPVKADLLAYYWDQGWPKELLLHLLVQKVLVRVKTKDNKTTDYYFFNHPDIDETDLCTLEKFTRWASFFVDETNPSFQRVDSPEKIGPELDNVQVNRLEDLINVGKENLQLEEVEASAGHFQLERPGSEYLLRIEVESDPVKPAKLEDLRLTAEQKVAEWAENSMEKKCRDHEVERYETTEDEHTHGEQGRIGMEPRGEDDGQAPLITVTLFTKSPESIIYYLGQLARIQERRGILPRICIGGKIEPLFTVREGTLCGEGVVNTEYDRKWFSIPRDPRDGRRIRDGEEGSPKSFVPGKAGRIRREPASLHRHRL